jgi:hypothetical protein
MRVVFVPMALLGAPMAARAEFALVTERERFVSLIERRHNAIHP